MKERKRGGGRERNFLKIIFSTHGPVDELCVWKHNRPTVKLLNYWDRNKTPICIFASKLIISTSAFKKCISIILNFFFLGSVFKHFS